MWCFVHCILMRFFCLLQALSNSVQTVLSSDENVTAHTTVAATPTQPLVELHIQPEEEELPHSLRFMQSTLKYR